MLLEILVERWFAIGSAVFGVSHVLYPSRWAALSAPLRERESAALMVGTFYLPLGLAIVLAHNVWAWELRVIVTFIGWSLVAKGVGYLLFPRALSMVMPEAGRLEGGFRIAGWVLIAVGALLAYDLFHRGLW